MKGADQIPAAGNAAARRVMRIGAPWVFSAPRLAFALVLAIAAIMLATPPARGQDGQGEQAGLLDKRNQIKQLEFEKEQVQRRLRDFHLTESEVLEEIEALSEQLREVKWRERHLSGRRKGQLRKSRQQSARIRTLTAQIEGSRERVGRHLRRLYRLSKAGDSASLIALARYKDFFKDVRYLTMLMAADRREIEQYVKLNEHLSDEQVQVQATLARLAELEDQLKQERAELKRGQDRLSASVEDMRRNKKLYKKYLGELDALREGMETAIARMEQNRRIKSKSPQVQDPVALRGALPPPTKGSLVAAFGQQDPRYDLKKFQRGIVIRVGEAAPVHAIASGKVVHAGPFRGYQQLIVVDHGKGLFSVYGHLERLVVTKGATVQSGMRLGSATYQPVGKNYDVYFEIRWNGKAEDPVEWLRAESYGRQSANGGKS